jgi:hypothetical protein
VPDEPHELDYHRPPKAAPSWQKRFSSALILMNLVIIGTALFLAAIWILAG